jgi:transcriptional repressor NrdR
MVMEHLQKLDQVAYVRFASVYRQFKDINQFMDEVKGLLKTDKSPTASTKPRAPVRPK